MFYWYWYSITWFTDVVETIGFTVLALNSLTIIISGTDSSQSLIAVGISLTLVRDLLASIGVRVTEISGLNNMSLVGFYKVWNLTLQSESDWHPQVWSPIQIGVGYWQFRSLSWQPGNDILVSVSDLEYKCQTWTTAIRGTTVSSSTVEAVVIVFIADLVKPHTLRVLDTLSFASICVCVAEISNITVIVIPATA